MKGCGSILFDSFSLLMYSILVMERCGIIMQTHQVLLYYHYVNIENPESVRIEHLDFCKSLGLLGRV